MSLIIALKNEHEICMAADKYAINDYFRYHAKNSKIFSPFEDWIVGVVGDINASQFLQYELLSSMTTVPENIDKIYKTVALPLRERELEATVLIATKQGNIYTVYTSGFVLECELPYDAIGLGSDFAKTFLYERYRGGYPKNLKKVAGECMEAVSFFCPYISKEFDYIAKGER